MRGEKMMDKKLGTWKVIIPFPHPQMILQANATISQHQKWLQLYLWGIKLICLAHFTIYEHLKVLQLLKTPGTEDCIWEEDPTTQKGNEKHSL